MGNITIGNGTKTITIGGSGPGLVIATSTPTLPIVTTMELTYTRSSTQWLFSLNGLTQSVKNTIDSGGNIYVQLVRDTGNGKMTGVNETYFKKGPRTIRQPNYPNAVRDGYPGRYMINSFSNSFYQNMNLTTWINGLISKLSVKRASGNNSPTNFKNSNGYWFVKIKFCIRVEGSDTFQTAENNTYITLNFYNNDDQNINEDYILNNNQINITAA